MCWISVAGRAQAHIFRDGETGSGLAGEAEHAPHVGANLSQRGVRINVPLAAHLKSVTTVVSNELQPLGLEIARDALGIGPLERDFHQACTQPLSLPVRMRGEQLQIPVRFGGLVRRHRRTNQLKAGEHLGRRWRSDLDLFQRRRPRLDRREPDSESGSVAGAPRLLVCKPVRHGSREDGSLRLEVHLIVRVEPPHHRIVVKGPHRRGAQIGKVGISRPPDVHVVNIEDVLRPTRGSRGR